MYVNQFRQSAQVQLFLTWFFFVKLASVSVQRVIIVDKEIFRVKYLVFSWFFKAWHQTTLQVI